MLENLILVHAAMPHNMVVALEKARAAAAASQAEESEQQQPAQPQPHAAAAAPTFLGGGGKAYAPAGVGSAPEQHAAQPEEAPADPGSSGSEQWGEEREPEEAHGIRVQGRHADGVCGDPAERQAAAAGRAHGSTSARWPPASA